MTAKEALATISKDYPYLELDLFNTIAQDLSELEAIKSADGGEALEVSKLAEEMLHKAYSRNGDVSFLNKVTGKKITIFEMFETLNNTLLKSQAQERELEELKEKVSLSHKDFIELLEGYNAYMEFAPKSNFDGNEQDFYNRLEDYAIGQGSYKKEVKSDEKE